MKDFAFGCFAIVMVPMLVLFALVVEALPFVVAGSLLLRIAKGLGAV